jgi:hypothetical protein
MQHNKEHSLNLNAMKFLIYTAALIFGISTANAATTYEETTNDIAAYELAEISGSNAVVRVVEQRKELYVIFQGPSHRKGDLVSVKVFTTKGQMVLNSSVLSYGNNQMEVLAIDGLEPGTYQVVVSSQMYNTEHSFTLGE